jgi:hypothetical protein
MYEGLEDTLAQNSNGRENPKSLRKGKRSLHNNKYGVYD